MTPKEFGIIFREQFLIHYPDLDQYCNELKPETKRAWAGLFGGIQSQDLETAIRWFVSGAERIPFHRDELATRLRVASRRAASQRYELERHESEVGDLREMKRTRENRATLEEATQVGGAMGPTLERAGLGPAFREIWRRVESGENRVDVTKEVVARIRSQQ